MSRVGKMPVLVPKDVQVQINKEEISIKGKLGELKLPITRDVKVVFEAGTAGGQIVVSAANDSKTSRAMWGTVRNKINNIVKGVSSGFETRVEIFGVGFKAAVDTKVLTLSLGYSHEIKYAIPQGISIKCEKPTLIIISGADKQKVGQIAGELMEFRPVEPYKGKGVYKEGTKIRRKEGKKK